MTWAERLADLSRRHPPGLMPLPVSDRLPPRCWQDDGDEDLDPDDTDRPDPSSVAGSRP